MVEWAMTIEAEPTFAIEAERVVLFLPQHTHADAIADYHARNAHHLAPWSPPRPPNFATPEYWRGRVRVQQDAFSQGRAAQLVFALRDAPERIIGTVALTEIVRGALRACFLGYGIDAREEGRGLMREAVRAIVRHAFDTLKLHRVHANYMPTNERSAALLKSLGFVVEGYARDYLFIDGAFRDHVLTALVNHELEDAAALCTPA